MSPAAGEISIRHVFYVVKQRELDFLEKGNSSTSCRDFLQQVRCLPGCTQTCST